MQKILSSKARVVSSIQDAGTRKTVLQHAIENHPTVREIKTMKQKAEGVLRELNTKELRNSAENTWASLKKSSVWNSPDKKEKLAVLLQQMNRLMQDSEGNENAGTGEQAIVNQR